MQAINWEQINDNIINVGQVLAKLVDTETKQNVEFVLIDNNGNVKNIKMANLAIHLANIKQNAVDATTVEKLITEKSMSKEDIEKYVNSNIERIETAVKAANGNTGKLQDLMSQYYSKDDIDAILAGIKATSSSVNQSVQNTILQMKINTSNISDLTAEVSNLGNKLESEITTANSKVNEVEDSLNILVIKNEATLDVSRRYAAETINSSYTVKLPNNPIDGNTIYLMDGSYNAQNNPITVDRNGKQINGKEDNLICDVNGFYIVMRYNGTKGSWYMANVVTK